MTRMTRILPPPSFLTARRRLLVAALATSFVDAAQALPVGPQPAMGTASFSQTGNVLTINNSNNAILNWQSFNIAVGESVRFNQPSASSSVLNRVLGSDPSALLGQLGSNGRVWLINPAGILVGPGARIDTAGFVASTLNIRNEDFLAGRLNFQNTPGAGSVVNQGSITTPSGGSVYLVAPSVSNEGIITTPHGETILAAGQTVELIDTATPGVKVEITGATGDATNLGNIVAEAGRVGMVGVLVRNSGNLNANANANSVVNEGGRIFLKARQDTYVDKNAQLSAVGGKGGKGGRIEVLGNRVAVVDSARLDASGQNGGGTVLVGGDSQGRNPDIQNARGTSFGKDAGIAADAIQTGDGGTVILWADDTMRAHGSISAHGGVDGGKGGFVETSGHHLETDGIRLKLGMGGRWLLDPYDMTIGSVDSSVAGSPSFTPIATGSTVAASTINALLDSGTSVTVDTTGAGVEVGDITVNTAITKASGADATLTLRAHDNVTINAGIASTAGKLNVVLQADQAGSAAIGIVNIGAASIVTNNGNFTASGKLISLNGSINAGSGTAWLYPSGAGRAVDLGAKAGLANTFELSTNELNGVTAGSLRVGATTAGSLNISAAIAPANVSTMSLESGGDVTQAGAGTISATNLAIKTLGNVMLGGAANMATNLAGQVGDASNQNKNFSFKNGPALNVGSNIDGVSGVGINISGSYSAGTPDGVIALASGGALTQSAGALLGGKAVYAEGSQVTLTNANPTGVIAGKATGSTSADVFSYASSNGIQATTVNGFSGIQSISTMAPTGVVLSAGSAGIGQLSSAPIIAGAGSTGLSVTTSGPVGLMSAGNNVASLTSVGSVGQMDFNDSGALVLNGVATTANPVNITAGGLLIVKSNLSAGTSSVALTAPDIQIGVSAAAGVAISGSDIKLRATKAASAGAISTAGSSASTLTASNTIELDADNHAFAVAPALNASSKIGYRTYTDNRSITVGTACNGADPNCLLIGGATNNAPDLVIGNDVAANTDTSGNIHVDTAISNASGRVMLLSGGGVTQTAAISATGLGVSAGGAVVLDASNAITNLVGKTSSGGFSLTNSQSLTVTSMTGSGGAASGVTAAGAVSLKAVGSTSNLTLNAPIASMATGDAVVLAAGGSFTNSGGSISLTGAGSPRWLVYAAGPASVTKNGLTSAFRHYGTTYSSYPSPSESGNGFIYASAPGALSVDTTLASGAASHTYGVTPTAAFGYTYSNAYIADAEDLAQIGGTPIYTPGINSVTPAGVYSVKYASGLTSAAGYGFTAGIGLIYTVNPAPLTVVTAALTGSTSKTYDATTSATLTPANFLLSGFVGSDNASVTKTSGNYASKSVGSGIMVSTTLTSADYTPAGSTKLTNYSLPTSASGNIGSITPATLGISGVVANDKVYDATTIATLNTGAALLSGVLVGDVVGVGAAGGNFADKNVGTAKVVTPSKIVLTGADAGNYVVTSPTALSASITPASIGVSGLTANDKVYDATSVATLNSGSALLTGVYAGDAVGIGMADCVFADKNVGTAKAVSVNHLALTGADAGNYALKPLTGLSASITPATIASVDGIVASDKVYDGSVNATLDTAKALFKGLFGSDALTVGSASGSFSDKEVGVGKTVNIGDISLSGPDAGNYILARNTASTTASISAPAGSVPIDTAPLSNQIDQVVNTVNTNTQPQPDATAAIVPQPPTATLAVAPSSLAPQTVGGISGEFGSASSTAPAPGPAGTLSSPTSGATAGTASTTTSTGPSTSSNSNVPAASSDKDAKQDKKDKKDEGNGDGAKKPAAEKPAAKKLPMCS